MIYVEEIIGEINLQLHGTNKLIGLEKQIELMKLIKGENKLDEALILLDKIRVIRNTMVHNLEYKIEEDKNFCNIFKIDNKSTIEEKKWKIAMYFKDIVVGILPIRFGLSKMDNFIFM